MILLWPAKSQYYQRKKPIHFQSDQILQFLICVLKNLMVLKNLKNCIPAVLQSTQLEDTAVTELPFRSLAPEAGNQESDL